jgi:hypothetical protein
VIRIENFGVDRRSGERRELDDRRLMREREIARLDIKC